MGCGGGSRTKLTDALNSTPTIPVWISFVEKVNPFASSYISLRDDMQAVIRFVSIRLIFWSWQYLWMVMPPSRCA